MEKEAVVLHRALFLSDVHLAARGCRAETLLDFLRNNEAATIYLVGDIVDFWRVKRGAVWPQSHSSIVQALLDKVRGGTKLVFIPGNHDEGLLAYCGTHLSGIEIVPRCTHIAADGRRLLVIHGDQFDVTLRFGAWLSFLSRRGQGLTRLVGAPLRLIRRHLGMDPWSLSSYLKVKVKTAVDLVGEFEQALITEARRCGVDGIICGHIHSAARREVAGIQYLNCGDWVDSCTAVAEDADGRFQLIRWLEVMRARRAASVATSASLRAA
jgi:UDP-2,3-diacylglucosamine pyrophosphatase LpxH